MKNFLFILTLLLGALLFDPNEETDSEVIPMHEQEVMMKEKDLADMQHHLEVLSSELKGSNCLTPRRTIQSSGPVLNLRFQKNAEKILQDMRLKEANLLRKVSESVSINQTINLSTLFCRMASHVYVLRKLII